MISEGGRDRGQRDTDGDGTVDFGESYVYDGTDIVLDFVDADGEGVAESPELAKRYLWGSAVDQLLAQEDATGTGTPADVVWPLTDHLGTVRDLVDSTAAPLTHYQYDTYGNITLGDTTLTRYLFTSQEFDLESGFYYYDARYYDPATGKFISEDIIGFDANDANMYRYVGNAATTLMDPLGTTSYERIVKKGPTHWADYGRRGDIWWDSTDEKATTAAFELIREKNATCDTFEAILVSTDKQGKILYTTSKRIPGASFRWFVMPSTAPAPVRLEPPLILVEGLGGQTKSYVIEPGRFMRSVVNVFDNVLLEGIGGTMFSAEMGDAKALDAVQEKAGYIGLIPWVGEPVDLFNAGVHLIRGNPVQAAWCGTAAIPFVGMVLGSTKTGRRIFAYFGMADEVAAANRIVTNAGQELRDLTIKGWRKGKGAPHFIKHGRGMGFNNLDEYTQAAKRFQNLTGHVTETKVGNLLFKFDHATERILIVSAKERTIVTFYKAKNGILSFFEAMQEHLKVIQKLGH